MNSEHALVYYLLHDPSLVDRIFDLGFQLDFLKQEQTRLVITMSIDAWYGYRSRPLVKQLFDMEPISCGIWRNGKRNDRYIFDFHDDKPSQSIEQAIENIKTFHLKTLILEKIKNGH